MTQKPKKTIKGGKIIKGYYLGTNSTHLAQAL